MSTAASKRWMSRVASIGCIVCIRLGHGETPAAVHHIREGRIARNDWLTLPLCTPHHTGSRMSIHMGKRDLLDALGINSEYDLLADVISRVA